MFQSILFQPCSPSSCLLCEHHLFPRRLRGSGRQRVMLPSTAPCLCVSFSPLNLLSSALIIHSKFRLQMSSTSMQQPAQVGLGKKPHVENRHCLFLGEYCFIFLLLLCPVRHRALAQVQINCRRESVLEVISCICDYAERDVRKNLSSK